ncbi:hypothetical protein AA313_de0201208 [Arthrobotrys entomopaga]|nr:hypothetical protein AA313_de0201208 [Arthrobotrys entomopaga]
MAKSFERNKPCRSTCNTRIQSSSPTATATLYTIIEHHELEPTAVAAAVAASEIWSLLRQFSSQKNPMNPEIYGSSRFTLRDIPVPDEELFARDEYMFSHYDVESLMTLKRGDMDISPRDLETTSTNWDDDVTDLRLSLGQLSLARRYKSRSYKSQSKASRGLRVRRGSK